MVLEALQGHDRGDLAVRHELSTEVEEGGEIGVWQVGCLVWVFLFVGCVGDVAWWWTGGHQCVAGEGHVFIVGFGYGASTEVVCVFAARTFESVWGFLLAVGSVCKMVENDVRQDKVNL